MVVAIAEYELHPSSEKFIPKVMELLLNYNRGNLGLNHIECVIAALVPSLIAALPDGKIIRLIGQCDGYPEYRLRNRSLKRALQDELNGRSASEVPPPKPVRVSFNISPLSLVMSDPVQSIGRMTQRQLEFALTMLLTDRRTKAMRQDGAVPVEALIGEGHALTEATFDQIASVAEAHPDRFCLDDKCIRSTYGHKFEVALDQTMKAYIPKPENCYVLNCTPANLKMFERRQMVYPLNGEHTIRMTMNPKPNKPIHGHIRLRLEASHEFVQGNKIFYADTAYNRLVSTNRYLIVALSSFD